MAGFIAAVQRAVTPKPQQATSLLHRVHVYILDGNDITGYLVSILLPLAAITLSRLFRMAHTAILPESFDAMGTHTCIGYCDRWNWTWLVLFLPMALAVLRKSSNHLFPLNSRLNIYRISDRAANHEDLSKNLRNAAVDGRNLLVSLCLTILIHVFDVAPLIHCYWKTLQGFNPTAPPGRIWDWTLWYFTNPHNHKLIAENFTLLTVAYASQFLIVLFAMELIVLLYRHNRFYLDMIYLRQRAQNRIADDFIVLDFNHDDERFGLSRLADQFDIQIVLLAIAGSFTLISRYFNADTTRITDFIGSLGIGEPSQLIGRAAQAIFIDIHLLFPNIGQVMFIVGWLMMLVVVLSPARVKLLPIRVLSNDHKTCKEYLLQFLPPGSPLDIQTNSLATHEDVNAAASKFAANSFWPVGDSRAEYVAVGAFTVFFLMLAPVLPVKHPICTVIYYCIVLAAAYGCSKLLFWLFKYRLRSIDRRLIEREK